MFAHFHSPSDGRGLFLADARALIGGGTLVCMNGRNMYNRGGFV